MLRAVALACRTMAQQVRPAATAAAATTASTMSTHASGAGGGAGVVSRHMTSSGGGGGGGAGKGAIDAWVQPFFSTFEPERMVPEANHLFEKTGMKLDAGPAELIARMDKAGIEASLICAWCRPGKWLVTNDEVAEICKQYPGRLFGVATVDLSDPVAAVAELERAVTKLGCIALRIIPWLWNLPPNNKLYYPLYVKCVQLGIPFCTQVGHTGPLLPSDVGRPIPYIDEIALAFPDLVIVGGHTGYPWTDEMIALAWKYKNVYIDTSAFMPAYYPPQLVHFMQTYGRKKVLFASDYPMLSPEACVEGVEDLDLSERVSSAFLRDNAIRVFKLPLAPNNKGGARSKL